VDSCLGGFVVNFLENVDSAFLDMPGVTSLSCDTHKNGWAPKGSSVLITKSLADLIHPPKINIAFYGAYAIPDWDGGIYGTPSNPGSQRVTHILHAYLAMLRIGKNGYRRIASAIHSVVTECSAIVEADPRLEILGDSSANVVAFQMSNQWQNGWEKGAVYALSHELSKRKVVLSVLSGARVHFCVTARSALDPGFVPLFREALQQSLQATESHNIRVKAGKIAFPGDGGLYGTMEAALQPTQENTKNAVEYYSNLILGPRVVQDTVKGHFYALQDPFIAENI